MDAYADLTSLNIRYPARSRPLQQVTSASNGVSRTRYRGRLLPNVILGHRKQADVLDGSRLVWGLRGYYFILLCQVGMTTCFYGIQLVYGYLVRTTLARRYVISSVDRPIQCVKVVVGAMIPSFLTMHNSFSTNLPTNDFICMVVFIVVSAVLQAFKIKAWTEIGKYGGALTVITFITIVSVCCAEAGGVGPYVHRKDSA